jgi:hypothetical protein
MIRHGLVHSSPGYICPFCPDREHRYPRPDNLQRWAQFPGRSCALADHNTIDMSAFITRIRIRTTRRFAWFSRRDWKVMGSSGDEGHRVQCLRSTTRPGCDCMGRKDVHTLVEDSHKEERDMMTAMSGHISARRLVLVSNDGHGPLRTTSRRTKVVPPPPLSDGDDNHVNGL